MLTPRYALVAYVRNPVGEFVERLRRQLHPELPHLAAHLTVLPPRLLQGTEGSAVEILEEICSQVKLLVGFEPKGFCQRRLHLLSLIMLDVGCRVSECTLLKVADCDLENLLMTLFGKGRKQRCSLLVRAS